MFSEGNGGREAQKGRASVSNGMKEFIAGTIMVGVILFVVVGGLGGACLAYPHYQVYSQTKAGEAKLREAQSSRQIAVEEAKAFLEAAKFQAQAEVERARGVAEANKIIGNSLRDNEAYLRYLWIVGLHDGSSEVIYIPTEANLPILEATRGLSTGTAAP